MNRPVTRTPNHEVSTPMTDSVSAPGTATAPQLIDANAPVDLPNRIDIRDLDIYYGEFKAVEGVSMTINPRSVTALIGPSGCGKSTFLRSLNRMHEVVKGAYVDG